MTIPAQRSSLSEFVLRARLETANAYRRLAQDAAEAALLLSVEAPEAPDALARVEGRISSLRHAQRVMEATLAGANRGLAS